MKGGEAVRLPGYLDITGEKQSAFAKRIKRPQSSVSRYLSGEVLPDRETMVRIALATGGMVMPNDFYDGLPEPRSSNSPVTVSVTYGGLSAAVAAEVA